MSSELFIRERMFLPTEKPDFSDVATEIHDCYLAVQAGVAVVRIRKKVGSVTTFEWARDTIVIPTRNEIKITREQYEAYYPNPDFEVVQSIDKTRHTLRKDGYSIGVDIYHGKLEGLVIAGVRSQVADGAHKQLDHLNRFTPFDWMGVEVTGDPFFFDHNLVLLNSFPFDEKIVAGQTVTAL